MKSARKADGAQGRGQALPGLVFRFSVFGFQFSVRASCADRCEAHRRPSVPRPQSGDRCQPRADIERSCRSAPRLLHDAVANRVKPKTEN